MAKRDYTTRRSAIVDAFVDKLEQINGTGNFKTTVASVEPRLKFWDEISEFPIFYEKELKLADVLLVNASEYKEISEQRIKYLNALTNGN